MTLFFPAKMFHNPRFRQSVLLALGTAVNSILGLGFYVLTARNLTVADFGHFSFFIGLAILAADMSEMGMSSAVLRFGKTMDLPLVLTVVWAQRVLAVVFLVTVSLLASFLLPINFFWVAIIAGGLLVQYTVVQPLLLFSDYGSYAAVNILGNIFRLLATVLVVIFGRSDPNVFLGLFLLAILTVAGGAIMVVSRKRGLIWWGKGDWRGVAREIYRFSRWSGPSFSLAALGARLDLQMVFLLAGAASAGIYSSAQKLVSIFPQFLGTIESVFAPKMAGVESRQFRIFLREYLLIVILLSFGLVLILPIAGSVVSFIFGSKYEASVPVLKVLIVGMLAFFLSGPFSTAILYYHGRSFYHFLISVVSLAVGVILYIILIPTLGALGAAWAYVGVNVSVLVTSIAAYSRVSDENNH